MAEESTPTPRYDVLITGSRGYRAGKAAMRSLIYTLAFRGFANPTDEAIAKTWEEVYMETGPSPHEVFTKYGYEGPTPVFLEVVVRTGEEPAELTYGPKDYPVYFYIEFRGCVFKEPEGPFRKILLDSLNLRASIFTREHVALPPHKTVEDDEKPEEKKKRERGPGVVGSDVDEW